MSENRWAVPTGTVHCVGDTPEVTALRAALTAAEARADELDDELTDREEEVDELIQRCERLAAYARAQEAYDVWCRSTHNLSDLTAPEWLAYEAARQALQPGDLGGEGEP